MEVRFITPTLESLDALKTEALCFSVFTDERPLSGAGGLVDWRLCGALSRLLLSHTLQGELHERLMMPGRPRLPAERLLFVGAGSREGFGPRRYREVCSDLVQTLAGLRLRGAAIALPGRVWEAVDPESAIEEFLSVTRDLEHSLDEVVLLDTQAAQRVMQPLVDRERRRATAEMDS